MSFLTVFLVKNISEFSVQNICIFNLINYGPDLKAILFLFEKKKCEV